VHEFDQRRGSGESKVELVLWSLSVGRAAIDGDEPINSEFFFLSGGEWARRRKGSVVFEMWKVNW
jgi:hypothetical protein